ncbi:hypothetical protein HK100_000654 [Physocladia obscura]|uniref:RAP domain-containing protein n=1 Tax=Physocladia obscura TaxID=109957 RepID=A0AAD5T431_9FUNG|nr:hypothetical protein HK100_000654 [Physocladia obscura]
MFRILKLNTTRAIIQKPIITIPCRMQLLRQLESKCEIPENSEITPVMNEATIRSPEITTAKKIKKDFYVQYLSASPPKTSSAELLSTHFRALSKSETLDFPNLKESLVLLDTVKDNITGDIGSHLLRAIIVLSNRWRDDAVCRDCDFAAALNVVVHAIEKDVHQCSPRSIATIISTLANYSAGLQQQHNRVVQIVANEGAKKIQLFNAQEITNSVAGLAKLGINNKAFVKASIAEAINKAPQFNARGVSNILNSYTNFGLKNDKLFWLFCIFGSQAIKKVHLFKAKSLSETLLSFAKIEMQHTELFRVFGDEALKNPEVFEPQDISNILRSFAKLWIKNDELFCILGNEAINKIHRFNAENLSHMLFSFATLGIRHKELFEAVVSQGYEHYGNFNSQALVNTAAAFAFMDQAHLLIPIISNELESHIFSTENMRLLHIWHISLSSEERASLQPKHQEILSGFSKSFNPASTHLNNIEILLTKSHPEITWTYNYRCPQTRYTVHFASVSERLAVTFNRPSSYVKDSKSRQYHLKGMAQLKQQLLEKYGWKVFQIDYRIWNALKHPLEPDETKTWNTLNRPLELYEANTWNALKLEEAKIEFLHNLIV